jgi:hypothetical protein
LHPKHHNPVVLRRITGPRAELSKGERVGNNVIGRKSNDDGIAAAPEGIRGTRGDGRPGIPTRRLEQNICSHPNRR